MTSPVTVSLNREGTRAAFRLFHPKGNILTEDMVNALQAAIDSLVENPHLKLITIEGHGPDFSFGASVPEHAPSEIRRVLPAMHALINGLLDAPAITAAVVRGRCLGGGFELALACDFIFASSGAVMGLPEIALGVFPPAASALLPMRIGAARATRAILTGDARPADEWKSIGLVELVAPAESLDAEVDRWYDLHLASRSAVALRHAAAAARSSVASHVRGVLPDLERRYLDDLMQTADAAEGIAAFLEKRSPRWTDG
jgi:cyclohexa-1,5-dienecarbonyl-CoA hydratase